MQRLYNRLNELIKSYHVFNVFNKTKAAAILTEINKIRLHIATIADQRDNFIDQLPVAANATGYKNDIFFSRDDIESVVSRAIAFLAEDVTINLIRQGNREQVFTREAVAWQQLFSDVQDATANGQQIPFDFNQEIFLDKNETLNIGVTNQTTAGMIFVHGANLLDADATNTDKLLEEITAVDMHGNAVLPQMQLVPIQYKFTSASVDTKAVAVDGGLDIFSIKSDQTVILTEVSNTAPDCRLSLTDKGRNQTICTEVESRGIAGTFTNQFSNFFPLPYPQILRKQDRIQLRGLNGSLITSDETAANVIQTLCFRGFTI